MKEEGLEFQETESGGSEEEITETENTLAPGDDTEHGTTVAEARVMLQQLKKFIDDHERSA